MYAKERTLKPEKYSQKPSARNEAVLSERKKNKILGKLSLGDDPGGILGRTINFSSENVHRRNKIVFTYFHPKRKSLCITAIAFTAQDFHLFCFSCSFITSHIKK